MRQKGIGSAKEVPSTFSARDGVRVINSQLCSLYPRLPLPPASEIRKKDAIRGLCD